MLKTSENTAVVFLQCKLKRSILIHSTYDFYFDESPFKQG